MTARLIPPPVKPNVARDIRVAALAVATGTMVPCEFCARMFIRSRSSFRSDCKVYCSTTCANNARAKK